MPIYGNIESLPWESEFFHLNSAKLTLDPSATQVITCDELSDFSLVQAKVFADQTDILDGLYTLGFQLVEGEVDFCITLDRHHPITSVASDWRIASEQDISAVCQTAEKAFQFSRFRAPWYQPEDSGRFYALWAQKAILGTFDNLCLLVCDEAGRARGFVTLRLGDPGEARIGLLAVWPDAMGQGVGKKLMAAAIQWCTQQGVSRLRVATQTGNIAALNLYMASGANIVRSAYWLYR